MAVRVLVLQSRVLVRRTAQPLATNTRPPLPDPGPPCLTRRKSVLFTADLHYTEPASSTALALCAPVPSITRPLPIIPQSAIVNTLQYAVYTPRVCLSKNPFVLIASSIAISNYRWLKILILTLKDMKRCGSKGESTLDCCGN